MTTQPLTRQPVIFIPHGAGPCFFMDWQPADTWVNMSHFLKGIAATLPQRPAAIIVVSAHWMTPQFAVTGHPQPDLIYDYYGFPDHTYELAYPAPGQPQLAQQVVGLIQAAGLEADVDPTRGFDHGVFIPMKLMFAEADIPVLQLSLRQDLDPQAHLALGRSLAPLRDENVLIIGSGMSFHNMRGYGDSRFSPISADFDQWLTQVIESETEQRDTLLAQWSQGPRAYLCHPQGHEEHLIPLHVVAGAAPNAVGKKVYSEQVMKTTISAFQFD